MGCLGYQVDLNLRLQIKQSSNLNLVLQDADSDSRNGGEFDGGIFLNHGIKSLEIQVNMVDSTCDFLKP